MGLVEIMSAFGMVYRPFFSLQAWTWLQLFGLHYVYYQVMELVLLGLAALTVYAVARRVLDAPSLALLLALAFASHPYISDLTNWPVDTATWTVILAGLAALLLLRLGSGARWFGALALVMMLAPFTRENGLAIIAAVVGAAAYARYVSRLTTRQVGLVAVMALLAVVGYFVVRGYAGGASLRPSQLIEESGMWGTFYGRNQVIAFTGLQRLGYFAYNAIGHAWASFLPVFMPCGVIWPRLVGMLAAVTLAAGAMLGLASPQPRSRTFTGLLMAIGAVALVAIVGLVTTIEIDSGLLALGLALHGVLVVFSVGVLARRGSWTTGVTVLAVYALILVAANSAVAFPYFRFRSLYLGLMGWVLLLAFVFKQHPAHGRALALRRVAIWIVAALVIVNGLRVSLALPVASLLPENFNSASVICRPEIPDGLAVRVAQEVNLEPAALTNCRLAAAAPQPAPAPGALEQGELLLLSRHCGRSY